jgi:hypothetical protein
MPDLGLTSRAAFPLPPHSKANIDFRAFKLAPTQNQHTLVISDEDVVSEPILT